MNRYLLIAFAGLLGLCPKISATPLITNADEITEKWLFNAGAENGYTDHVPHFKRLFNKMPVRTFLEFGLGFSTKFFIDNCDQVISVEFVTPGTGPEWLKYCIDLYRDFDTWVPIAFFAGNGLDTSWARHKYIGSESVYKATAYQPAYHKNYALIDPSYLDNINSFLENHIAIDTIDVAFVDAGVCIRGDLVQLLFNKAPIIVAHDIYPKNLRHPDTANDYYGYGRILVPKNYIEIHVPLGVGTSFWVKREDKYLEIICDLQNYVNEILLSKAHQNE